MAKEVDKLYKSEVQGIEDIFTREELIKGIKLEMLDIMENLELIMDCPHALVDDGKSIIVFYVEKPYTENKVMQYYITHEIVKEWELDLMKLEKIALANMEGREETGLI